MKPHELWARAYSQYIATRSGDKYMKMELDRLREDKLYNGGQWSDKDFEPIAKAIDDMFTDLGWISSAIS